MAGEELIFRVITVLNKARAWDLTMEMDGKLICTENFGMKQLKCFPFLGQSLVGRRRSVIDCRTMHNSYFADPDDCRMFYHCSDWAGLEHKSCGALFFHPQKRVCDWPRIVRR